MQCLPLLIAAAALCLPLSGVKAQVAERVAVGFFFIDRTEVSIGDFRAFAKNARLVTTAERIDGSHEFAGSWVRRQGWTYLTPTGAPGADSEPAVHISWSEARSYCTAAGGRLPTFAEWRSAAYTEQRDRPADGFVNGKTYVYPVGDTPEGMNNNRRRHTAVGTTRRGINGLYDMGGNVWEWLLDRSNDDALTAGGSWWYGPEQTMESAAQWKPAAFTALYIGFRCVYDRAG
jgi:formylglycine-generating enzyme